MTYDKKCHIIQISINQLYQKGRKMNENLIKEACMELCKTKYEIEELGKKCEKLKKLIGYSLSGGDMSKFEKCPDLNEALKIATNLPRHLYFAL